MPPSDYRGRFFYYNMKIRDIIILVAILTIVGIYIDLRRSGVLNFSSSYSSRDTVIVNLPQQTYNFPPGQPINIINQQMPAKIDTGAILKAFFSEVTYLDSLDNDTVKIVLKEIIGQNAVRSRELTWKLKRPLTTTVNNYIAPPRRLMVGAMISGKNDASASGIIAWKNRREQVYFGAYDPFQKRYSIGAIVPIKSPNP